ncbi:MAG: acetyl-CoA carboxylase biotin carboxylase subunit [Peptostreptococcaceae bacterium]|nr:acetyl-CoA carboxylase biotin carboxylase subunit [Peptostreptococcaceae bacterium]
MIKKILIANRGEIAVRIIRACRELGIETVAVYSETDAEALHTQLADSAICIGPASATESYLNMERIISATIISGADAIHPGFGFLSENSKFAKLCYDCNITFIGPSYEVIENLGNKSNAKTTMKNAGVPVIEGSKDPIIDIEEGRKIAGEIGYPVIIKAVLGGGGKGMRIANSAAEFNGAFSNAKKESKMAFSDDRMYIEKYIENPRHIEFQILADKYGNVVHLGERECSIQRNHQKLLEEAPSSAISSSLRNKMGEVAVNGAKAAKYENAGTIEFLLDEDGSFYFMEMNTRIQVEHPVTEEVTGIDLIKEQIRIAEGDKMNLKQEDIVITGHAIECRINAEDPEENFRPSPGEIKEYHMPGGNGIRIDSAIYQGIKISPYYDSMIAKIIVHGKDRKEAIRKMDSALGELVINGIKTNTHFQHEIVNHKNFKDGNFTIKFIDEM